MTLLHKSSQEDKSLLSWIAAQKTSYNSYTLSPKRRQLLESIGLKSGYCSCWPGNSDISSSPGRTTIGESSKASSNVFDPFAMMEEKESMWILHSCNHTVTVA
eukprot:185154-Hanusia_phi.AAC.7